MKTLAYQSRYMTTSNRLIKCNNKSINFGIYRQIALRKSDKINNKDHLIDAYIVWKAQYI